jgi:hypothetical protein
VAGDGNDHTNEAMWQTWHAVAVNVNINARAGGIGSLNLDVDGEISHVDLG